MTQKILGALVAGILLAASSPAYAANKEHQQLMADLRMLQEQTQLLQNVLNSVTDTLKAVNTRLDQQAETTRKAFADQKLVIDNLTNDVRVIREKLDDNNVRLGSLRRCADCHPRPAAHRLLPYLMMRSPRSTRDGTVRGKTVPPRRARNSP